ncbi:MAG: hypothetical protein AAF493_19595 [Pseudomonadota bacterium]
MTQVKQVITKRFVTRLGGGAPLAERLGRLCGKVLIVGCVATALTPGLAASAESEFLVFDLIKTSAKQAKVGGAGWAAPLDTAIARIEAAGTGACTCVTAILSAIEKVSMAAPVGRTKAANKHWVPAMKACGVSGANAASGARVALTVSNLTLKMYPNTVAGVSAKRAAFFTNLRDILAEEFDCPKGAAAKARAKAKAKAGPRQTGGVQTGYRFGANGEITERRYAFAGVNFFPGGRGSSVVIGDIGGDASKALLVRRGDAISVLTGGVFGFRLEQTLISSVVPDVLQIVDADLDGSPDIVATELRSGNTAVWLNSPFGFDSEIVFFPRRWSDAPTSFTDRLGVKHAIEISGDSLVIDPGTIGEVDHIIGSRIQDVVIANVDGDDALDAVVSSDDEVIVVENVTAGNGHGIYFIDLSNEDQETEDQLRLEDSDNPRSVITPSGAFDDKHLSTRDERLTNVVSPDVVRALVLE